MDTEKQSIDEESKVAREEFTRIVESEKQRFQLIAEQENERIMQETRANGTIKECPICFDEIPPILPEDEKGPMVMTCCGAVHCKNCGDKSIDFMRGDNAFLNAKCYNCREPLYKIGYWCRNVKPEDRRPWVLRSAAKSYFKGKKGEVKKDIRKAMILYQRAAELGDALSQNKLAQIYMDGYFKDIARHYAEKAANQGIPASLRNLASFYEKENREEEAFRLVTLGAYQDCADCRIFLGKYYERKIQKGTSMKKVLENEECRKNLLLALF